jgi:hypothetical protein
MNPASEADRLSELYVWVRLWSQRRRDHDRHLQGGRRSADLQPTWHPTDPSGRAGALSDGTGISTYVP